MSAPSIRYATTRDGVRIAFGVMGEGEPLLYCRCPAGPPLAAVVGTPELDAWFGALAERYQLITFDFRGGGLSDRGERELSFETMTLDLLAVLDEMDLASANVQTEIMSSAAAINLAASAPHRVRRLVLWHPAIAKSQRSLDPKLASRWDKMFDSARQDWEMFCVRLLSESYDVPGEVTRRIAGAWADATSAEDFSEAWDPRSTDTAAPLLASVEAPTLVLQRENRGYYQTLEDGAAIAARIPNAALRPVPGVENFPYTDHPSHIIAEIERFLGDGSLPTPLADTTRTSAKPVEKRVELSAREKDVLALLADGLTDAAIAERLGVQSSTVSRHVHNILGKTDLPNRTALASYAHRSGLLRDG